MQTTYSNRTAGGILKTATVTKTDGGTFEIFVKLPNGRGAIAMQRNDGNMVLTDMAGHIATLEVSKKAESTLRILSEKCESMYS